MQAPELSPTSKHLADALQRLQATPHKQAESTIHVDGVASSIYFAYEQLRNSADYAQQHLLLRAAIERFLRRNIYLRRPDIDDVADDLIIELTQARYIANDTVATVTVRHIKQVLAEYTNFFDTLHTAHNIPHAQAGPWVYQVMSVLIERLISPQPLIERFADIAYEHYLAAVDRASFAKISQAEFEAALYCAVHRALLNSDQATVRAYWIINHPAVSFIELCQAIDTYFDHPLTHKLARLVGRYSAPMRTISELFVVQKAEVNLLFDKPMLLAKAETTIAEQYEQLRRSGITSLWRMVAFVFVTKMVIGVAIEIPYNLVTLGFVPILPLVINLAFPPLYMMSGALALTPPGRNNTKTILSYIERILYITDRPLKYRLKRDRTRRNIRSWFNAAYAVLFLVPFALVVWLLVLLGFHWLDGIVFFVFLSAVGFLRFRLLQASREMDIVDRPLTFSSAIGEFFHLPFATLGRWLSDRYQRLNIVAFVLDMAIELPLKTSLRVIRQWVSFIRDKRDMM